MNQISISGQKHSNKYEIENKNCLRNRINWQKKQRNCGIRKNSGAGYTERKNEEQSNLNKK